MKKINHSRGEKDEDPVLPFLNEFIPKDHEARILDAACGNGHIASYLVSVGYRNVDGVDLFEEIDATGFRASQGDLRQRAFEDETFDFVLCASAVCYLDNPRIGLAELVRVLKPGGRLLLTGPPRDSVFTWIRRARRRSGLESDRRLARVRFYPTSTYQAWVEGLGLEILHRGGCKTTLFGPQGQSIRRAGQEMKGGKGPPSHQNLTTHSRWEILKSNHAEHFVLVAEKVPRQARRCAPNFLLMGAAKCGTTSLTALLKGHPDVFMVDPPDLGHFAPDLWFHHTSVGARSQTLEGYQSFFKNRGGAQASGERTVWYLYSQEAARRIYEFNPNMKLIVQLRQPVDYMVSLYVQASLSGYETVTSFEEAISMSVEQRARRSEVPFQFAGGMNYRESARFGEQLRRLYDVFPKENVLVILLEDIVKDREATTRRILEFLGVRQEINVPIGSKTTRRKQKYPGVLRILGSQNPIKRALAGIIPYELRKQLYQRVVNVSTEDDITEKLSPALRRELTSHYLDDIDLLASLIDRDLSHWKV